MRLSVAFFLVSVSYAALFQSASVQVLKQLDGLVKNFCVDEDSKCPGLAAKAGECDRNPVYMKKVCRSSCRSCHELHRLDVDGYMDVALYALRNSLAGGLPKTSDKKHPALEPVKQLLGYIKYQLTIKNQNKTDFVEKVLRETVEAVKGFVAELTDDTTDPETDQNFPALSKSIQLENTKVRGLELPRVGFGTWKLPGETCEKAIADALAAGYRHIDTAQNYGNEACIGRALSRSSVPRSAVQQP